jgi:hypothetical protein
VHRVKEALLVTEKKASEGRGARERCRCEVGSSFDETFSLCVEPGKETVDGLLLCGGHALEAKLEGQLACWGGILFHVDLWSREARRRNRPRIVELLGVQRAEATSAMEGARRDLDRARGETSLEVGRPRPSTKDSPLLPPGDVRLHLRELRRRSRRWCDA